MTARAREIAHRPSSCRPMITPLTGPTPSWLAAKGHHVIRFAGAQPFSTVAGDPFDFVFDLDITYRVTVR